MADFTQTRVDGSPITCKFCRKPIWVHATNNRVYDVGGEVLHVENCPQRRAFYKNRSLDAAEERRQRRADG